MSSIEMPDEENHFLAKIEGIVDAHGMKQVHEKIGKIRIHIGTDPGKRSVFSLIRCLNGFN